MNATRVRELLEGLRAAGEVLRRRPAAQTLEALAQVLDAWSDPDGPWQKALCEALPRATGFHPETVRAGLAAGLAPYRGESLLRLVAEEIGGPEALDAGRASGFDVTAVVLAGAVPMPTLVAAIASLALRSPLVLKPASADPVTPSLVARSLASADPELGAAVATADLERGDDDALDALVQADCVVANGSDSAVSALAARLPAARRFVPYGHRFSVAVLGPEAGRGPALAAAAAGLARDVSFWDQLGCLSPIAVYAAGRPLADAFSESLAEALEQAQERWPRGAVDAAAAAQVANERGEAEMRAAAGRPVRVFAPGSGAGWTVVLESDAAPRPAPLHRFVRVHPCEGVDGCLAALRPARRHLAAVALAGFGSGTDAVARDLARLGASRVCLPGELQTPPLAWRRDNRGVLLPLVRGCDFEL